MANPPKAITMSTFQIHARSVMVNALIWIVVASVMAVVCQKTMGQTKQKFKSLKVADKYYTELPDFDATAKEEKDNRSKYRNANRAIREDIGKVDNILENNGNFSDPVIAEFFEGYVFPSMTLLDNRIISKLGEKRTKYIKDYLNPRVQGDNRTRMIDFTISGMKKVCVNPDLHPAARLNAVYLIGMLDQVPLVRFDNQRPVPSKAALSSLRKIFDSQDENAVPDYLKVAALAGIQRHIEIDRNAGGQIPAEEKQALLQEINRILDKPATDDLSYWLKRRGMQMIGLIGDPGSLDTAIAILKSEDAGILLKFDAMEAIGKLKLGSDTIAKNAEATLAISEFLAQSLENESNLIEAAVDKLVFDNLLFGDLDLERTGTDYQNDTAVPIRRGLGQGGGRGGDRGGPGGFIGGRARDPDARLDLPGYKLNLIRRRIKSLALRGAMVLGGENGDQGMSLLVDADGKKFVGEVVDVLQRLVEDSNVGIIDLESREELPEFDDETTPTTQQLIDLCKKSSRKIDGYVREQKGQPADEGRVSAPAEGDEIPEFK